MAKKKEKKRGKPSKFKDLKGVHHKMPMAMILEIEEKAKELDISRSEFVRRSVREYIDNKHYMSEPKENEITEFTNEDFDILSDLFAQTRSHSYISKEDESELQSLVNLAIRDKFESLRIDSLKKIYRKMIKVSRDNLYFIDFEEWVENVKKIKAYLKSKGITKIRVAREKKNFAKSL